MAHRFTYVAAAKAFNITLFAAVICLTFMSMRNVCVISGNSSFFAPFRQATLAKHPAGPSCDEMKNHWSEFPDESWFHWSKIRLSRLKSSKVWEI